VNARCDARRIEQVLHNLLANAVKYSPTGGTITMSVRDDSAGASVEVSDEGIGMTDAQRATLFEPFQRAGPPGIPGAGLGLSLVKRIVEAQGGAVEVESVPGMGSTFRVRFPPVEHRARPTPA
jgi:signal transduction histidine kinase